MASLADFYSPVSSINTDVADFEMAASDARTDAALAQSRLTHQFQSRGLPDLVNRHAAKGTFYGGQAGVQADRMKEDVANQSGDIQRMLDRQLSALRRQGILAATGVNLAASPFTPGQAVPGSTANPSFSAQPVPAATRSQLPVEDAGFSREMPPAAPAPAAATHTKVSGSTQVRVPDGKGGAVTVNANQLGYFGGKPNADGSWSVPAASVVKK